MKNITDKKVDLVKIFARHWRSNGWEVAGKATLVGVSGGVDSVVLVDLLSRLGYPFVIGHANFGLREGSDGDEAFVKALGEQYRVKVYTEHFDTRTYARNEGISIQMAARHLRYDWLRSLVEEHGYRAIGTGHHQGDVLETVIRHLVKGTGVKGLCGIKASADGLIRPLLFATKEDIIGYAEGHDLSWREDPSNQEEGYERNFIRHRIVPLLEVLNPGLSGTFEHTLGRLQEVDALLDHEIARLHKEAWSEVDGYYHIEMEILEGLPWAGGVLAAWLAPFGFYYKDIAAWVKGTRQVGKRLYSEGYWLLVERKRWVIGKKENREDREVVSEGLITAPEVSEVPWLQVKVYEREGYELRVPREVAALDLSKLTFPLVLRRWRAGDVFYPLTRGERYRKKVSDFLVDRKVPLYAKKGVKVLVSAGAIVWVVGYEIDDRFKVTGDTAQLWEAAVIGEG